MKKKPKLLKKRSIRIRVPFIKKEAKKEFKVDKELEDIGNEIFRIQRDIKNI